MANSYQNELQISLSDQADKIIKQLPDFANSFFDDLKNKNMSERTRIQYAYDMQKFFSFLKESAGFKDKKINTMTASEVLDPLTIDDINEYLRTLDYIYDGNNRRKKSSPSYRARKVSSLKSFFHYYLKIGAINTSVGDLIEGPKIPEKNVLVMDKEDVQRLLDASKDPSGLTGANLTRYNKVAKRDYAILMLLFGTGIRVSELIGINLRDIDFYNASLIINRKGGDEDEVYFSQEVEQALQDYIHTCRPTLLKDKTDALFISHTGTRLSSKAVQDLMHKYALKAGVNGKITPHACRRAFATNLYNETSDIYLVADALHHKSVETTRKHYAKISKDHKRIAAQKSSTLFKE